VAAGIGYRTVFDRLRYGLPEPCDQLREADTVADATFARLVASFRRTTDFSLWQMDVALEITPTAALAGSRLFARPR
jgi:hypothetical protein